MNHYVAATNIIPEDELYAGILKRGLRATLDTTVFGRTVPYVSMDSPMLDWNHLSINASDYCADYFRELSMLLRENTRLSNYPYPAFEHLPLILSAIRDLLRIVVETGTQPEISSPMPITYTADGLLVFYEISVSTPCVEMTLYVPSSDVEYRLNWECPRVGRECLNMAIRETFVDSVIVDIMHFISLINSGAIFPIKNTEQIECHYP